MIDTTIISTSADVDLEDDYPAGMVANPRRTQI